MQATIFDPVFELIGRVLGVFPAWVAIPAAFLTVLAGWALWIAVLDPLGSTVYEQWRDRRRREKELNAAKHQ